ncbi:MAG: hypothetical protein JSV34_06360, partial [Candidatus Omnitrophota bacterium]
MKYIALFDGIKLKLKSREVIKSIAIGAFLFCIGINVYLRVFPAYFPQYKQQAKINHKTKILNEIRENIDQLYPHYNPYAKEVLLKEMYKARLKDKEKLKEGVRGEYEKLKDKYQDERGQTYLLELDPYHWMRYTENVLKRSHPADKKVEGKLYDTYMLAPVGGVVPRQQFLFYLSAYLYKAFNFFNKEVSLQSFLFYLPLFYVLIFLVLVYFFTKSVFSHLAAFFTTLFIGLNAMFIQRSGVGWFDSDTLSLIIPLLIVWFILAALKNGDNLKRLVFFASLAALFQGLYPAVWIGWWFIFLVVVGFYACNILNNYLIHKDNFKKGNKENLKYLLSGSIFVVGSIFFGFLITKTNFIYIIFISIKENLKLGESLSSAIWPNTYYTVGELMSSNLSRIADYFYGKVIFLLSLIGMFCLYLEERRGERKDFFYIMFFWFVFMLFAALRSVRFSIFLGVPLGIFLGGFISNIPYKIIRNLSANPKLKVGVSVFFLLLCAVLLRSFLAAGYMGAKYSQPLMNDDWQKALTYIKDNTPADAIINSWWDYGDLFKTVGNRRVIFDGQSQNRPLAYWMGRALLAKDEKEALRILRMLNNASDKTFQVLNKHIPDSFECLVSLERLLSVGQRKARKLLSDKGVGDEDIEKIISDLHKEPAPAYFIVESSMLNKMHSISFLGNWDFRKLYVYRNINKPRKEIIGNLIVIFGLTNVEARKYYEEIVITPSGKSIFEAVSKRYAFYCPFIEG